MSVFVIIGLESEYPSGMVWGIFQTKEGAESELKGKFPQAEFGGIYKDDEGHPYDYYAFQDEKGEDYNFWIQEVPLNQWRGLGFVGNSYFPSLIKKQ